MKRRYADGRELLRFSDEHLLLRRDDSVPASATHALGKWTRRCCFATLPQ